MEKAVREIHQSGGRMKKGDKAPDFKVMDHHGRDLILSEILKKGPVVLFFYPADGSPVCSREACLFRDSLKGFDEFGATVIGISADSNEKHREFALEHNFPFSLVSDSDGKLRTAYDVKKRMVVIPGRETFVIGIDGEILLIVDSQLDPGPHVEASLKVLRELAG
ncbi:MAG: peroxiredoxin [Candidatus Wallbacteria bacterium HGW-Wallbacteria-1]|jgi:peroxiredoxin Q/BCP|uniref:thioredoxin-dependent peroxiredoxin n=1 Tax=Candidatus Wallbacteria bacterium HGW-Wallbacteria-1 TaxID=2013854 RepID=A0A2N1PLI3_9BACT|nr:MAG: peroxiredoxin [Candidatus Wallbacteria bacterium HGW-Wallbacteria-1]